MARTVLRPPSPPSASSEFQRRFRNQGLTTGEPGAVWEAEVNAKEGTVVEAAVPFVFYGTGERSRARGFTLTELVAVMLIVAILAVTATSVIASTMWSSKSSGKVKPQARRARLRVQIAGDRFDREIARDVAGDREGDIRSHVQAAERREPKRGVRRGDGDASRGGAREARLALRRWHRYRARARRIGAHRERDRVAGHRDRDVPACRDRNLLRVGELRECLVGERRGVERTAIEHARRRHRQDRHDEHHRDELGQREAARATALARPVKDKGNGSFHYRSLFGIHLSLPDGAGFPCR